jgi:hypothetical protein
MFRFVRNKIRSLIVPLAFPLGGCMLPGSSQTVPSSAFVFPNSNVYPLERVTGQSTRMCGVLFFTFGVPGGEDIERAQQNALRFSKGDMIINMRSSSSMMMIPMIASFCNATVEGTAARMEVGRQDITAAPVPSVDVPASSAAGCRSDADCKGKRVCRAGQCAAP